jgi:hypothetical protein
MVSLDEEVVRKRKRLEIKFGFSFFEALFKIESDFSKIRKIKSAVAMTTALFINRIIKL